MELVKNTIIDLLDNVRTESVEYYNEIVSEINRFKAEEATSLLNFMSDYLYSDERHYFTISSKDTFNKFENTEEGYTFVYSPLNDHSRPFMHKGDVVFCYRQGQFGSLEDALDTRGIYAVGICIAEPKEIYHEESGHNRWGVAITIPVVINKHLELRNIQLNPITINLTPYNGNRNDSLQYIEKSEHYKSLLELVCARNLSKKNQIEILLNKTIKDVVLPDDVWNNRVDNSLLLKLENNKFRPYISAIKSKPFLLLAGISGTGKSRIVRELARACWDEGSEEYKNHKPRNFEMVQVKPNWHDSSELLGYVSRIGADKDGNGVTFVAGDFLKFIARAWEEQNVPYFLCLDEMNLAPVEQYFAEYLSVVESRKASVEGVMTDPILKKSIEPWYFNLCAELTSDDDLRQQFLNDGISIPQNLIVIGTVNMDETTFSFSRKVLDRAMTIEMNEVDLYGGLTKKHEKIGKLGIDELVGTCVEGVDVYSSHKGVCDKVITYLKVVNDKLEGTPFKIAYRTRNEFLLYVVNNLPYNKNEEGEDLDQNFVIARALDEITNMKILSRIEGDETKVSEKFLKGLGDTIKEQLEMVFDGPFGIEETGDTYKSVSLAKLNEMTKKLSSGYTSFWS